MPDRSDGASRTAAPLDPPGPSVRAEVDERLVHLGLVKGFVRGDSTLLDALCSFIFHSFRGIIPFEHITVALIEGTPPMVRARWRRSELPGNPVPEGYSLPLTQTSLGEVARHGRPRILNDLEAYGRLHPESRATPLMLSWGVLSSLTCPLVIRGTTVGFVFFSSGRAHTYSGHHVQVFERIAHDLALVVEHTTGEAGMPAEAVTRLGGALQELTRSVAAGQREALLLGRITEKINAGIGMSQTLDFIYDEFRHILPYDRIGFALVDDAGERATACWARSSGGPLHLDAGFSRRLDAGSLGAVLRSGVPRVLNDLPSYLEDHPSSASTRLVVQEGLRSSLTCPLVALGRPVGFLFFSSRERGTYRNAHVERFTRLANQLAIIIEKGRLYEQLDEERRRNDRLLRELLPAQIVDQLQAGRHPPAELHPDCTVMIADLVGFTPHCRATRPQRFQVFLDLLFGGLDALTTELGVTKISVTGDAYLAVAGVPEAQEDHRERAIAMADGVHRLLATMCWPDGQPIEARVGLASGSVVAGLIGRHACRFDIWGDTVNTASRMQIEAEPRRTLIPIGDTQWLPDGYTIRPAGLRVLKGIGTVQSAWVRGPAAKD